MTNRFVNPIIKYTTSTLKTMPGAELYFYITGTSTPKVTYQDFNGTTPHANPVVALSDGHFPPIFLDGTYRAELKYLGVTQPGWPVDGIGATNAPAPLSDWNSGFSYSNGDLVTGPDGNRYVSLQDNNLNNDPTAPGSLFWNQIFLSGNVDSWQQLDIAARSGAGPKSDAESAIRYSLDLPEPTFSSYTRGNTDGTYENRTYTQVRTDLSLATVTDTSFATKVTGPAAVIDGVVALFDGATGKLIKAGDTIANYLSAFLVTLYSIFPRKINLWADIGLTTVVGPGQLFNLVQHTSGGYGSGPLISKAGSVTDDGGYQKNSGTPGFYLQRLRYQYHAYIEDFGGIPDGSTVNDTAFLNAKASLRRDPQSIQQNSGAGSPMVTAYASGTLEFGRGVYVISKNVMNITQEMSLTLQGQGHRGQNLSIRGATVLLCKGSATNTDFFINHYGNGARNLKLRDLDICYEDNTFNGVMIDSFDSPGLKMESCYVGTNALTGGTRLTTAYAMLRTTYEEFMNIKNCVFSGAQYGYYPDYSRTVDGSTFGGFGNLFDTCTFYDFVVDHVKTDSSRTKQGLKFLNCAFNPINTGPSRVFDLANVTGFSLDNCQLVPSTGLGAVGIEWALLDNVVGDIERCEFGTLTSAGTIQNLSVINIKGNQFGGSDGWTLKSGLITSSGNRFRFVTNGYIITPAASSLTLQLGVDDFKNTVTTSYFLPTDSTLLSGCINYSTATDNSTSKFSVLSPRVRVKSLSGKVSLSAAATLNISKLDTGDTIIASGVVNQVFTLPDPEYCLEFEIGKISASGVTLTVNASAGKNFVVGASGTRVSAVISNIGGALKFKAINQNTWQVVGEVGGWTYT